MYDQAQEARSALVEYQDRLQVLDGELRDINRALSRHDLLELARRTRELLRRTKGMLDGNVQILFHDQPASVPEELYRQIEYAQNHITRALSEEYEFAVIEKRLYMATSLSEHVIQRLFEAIGKLV